MGFNRDFRSKYLMKAFDIWLPCLICLALLVQCNSRTSQPKKEYVEHTEVARSKDSSNNSKQLRIAVVLRLDDQANHSVHSINSGLETAKAIFEMHNPGWKVEFVRFSHSEGEQSVRTAAERVVSSGLSVAVGGEWSSESLILADVLDRNGIVFITPTSTNPIVTEARPYAFRMCFTDDIVAKQMAKFTLQVLRPRVLGILHNASSPYSNYLSQKYLDSVLEMSAKLPRQQRPTIVTERIEVKAPPEYRVVSAENLDLKPQAEHFMQAHVTHVAVMGFQSDLLPFVHQSQNIGFHPTFIGSDGWGSAKSLFDAASESKINLTDFMGYHNYYYWDPLSTSQLSQEFRSQYLQLYKTQPTGNDAIAFDTAWLLLNSMKASGNSESAAAVRAALLNVKAFPLVSTERFQFEQNNSPGTELHVYEISHLTSRLYKTVQ